MIRPNTDHNLALLEVQRAAYEAALASEDPVVLESTLQATLKAARQYCREWEISAWFNLGIAAAADELGGGAS